jgi:hypothetical protein
VGKLVRTGGKGEPLVEKALRALEIVVVHGTVLLWVGAVRSWRSPGGRHAWNMLGPRVMLICTYPGKRLLPQATESQPWTISAKSPFSLL